MKTDPIKKLINRTQDLRRQDQAAVQSAQNRIVAAMVTTTQRETERLEHHLLELPLTVIIYQWLIIRLKSRPWRLLLPASLALSLLLQGILVRFNLPQLLAH